MSEVKRQVEDLKEQSLAQEIPNVPKRTAKLVGVNPDDFQAVIFLLRRQQSEIQTLLNSLSQSQAFDVVYQ